MFKTSDPATLAEKLPRRLPSLDGWRALSIILVLGSHSKLVHDFPSAWDETFRWLFDGNLGVRIFFVISGLLITWLLIKEFDSTGSIKLGRFYIRRSLRILPVYFTFLGVLFFIEQATPFRQSREQWIGNLTFTTNYVIHFTGPSNHLWSLAVEEQFYLLWPLMFVWSRLRKDPRLYGWLLSVVVLIAPICRVVSYKLNAAGIPHSLVSEYSFFNYFDSLAIGCTAAFVLAKRRERLIEWIRNYPYLVLCSSLLGVFTPYVLGKLFLMGWFTVPFGHTLQALGIAVLILWSILFPDGRFFKIFNLPWIVWLGTLSYSIYVWQQLFYTNPDDLGLPVKWWLSFPGWLVSAFGVAVASYYLLERPLFTLRSRFR
jgi:peptidoglycan/LPS O-acetylase OafA/YrhL